MVSAQRQQLIQQQQQLAEQQAEAERVAGEEIPQRRFGRKGVTKSIQEQYIQRREQANRVIVQIQQAQAQLREYEDKLSTSEAQQAEAEERNRQYEYGYQLAIRGKPPFFLKKYEREGYRAGAGKREAYEKRKRVLSQIQEFKAQGLKPITNAEGTIVGFEDTERQQSYSIEAVPQIVSKQPEQKQRFEKVGFTFSQAEVQQTTAPINLLEQARQQSLEPQVSRERMSRALPRQQETITQRLKRGYNEVNAYLSGKIEGFNTKLQGRIDQGYSFAGQPKVPPQLAGRISSNKVVQYSTGVLTGAGKDIKEKPLKYLLLVGAGGAISFGSKALGTAFVSLPRIKKVIDISIAVVGTGLTANYLNQLSGDVTGYKVKISIPSVQRKTNLVNVYKFQNVTAEQSGKALGIGLAEFTAIGGGAYLGLKGFQKTFDFIRTAGKTEVSSATVIAPESLAGKRYPEIRKGQTARQLKAEFYKPIPALKEKPGLPRMFTASPGSFKVLSNALPGSSELFGLYGSPKLNPTFLQLKNQGSYKFFSFKGALDTPFPTVLRTTLTGLEYAPGVTGRQKSLTAYNKQLMQFFGGGTRKVNGKRITIKLGDPKGKAGVAYIPFMKTEKEAILTVGSEFKVYSKPSYIKYQGRRVPIFQALTTQDILANKLPTKDFIFLRDFSSRYSSYNSGQKSSIYNPLSLTPLSFKIGSSKRGFSSSLSRVSSYLRSFISFTPSLKSGSSKASSRRKNASSSPISSLPSLPSFGSFRSSIPSRASRPSRSSPRSPFYYLPRSQPLRSSPRSYLKGFSNKAKGGFFVQAFRTFFISGGKKKYLPGLNPRGKALLAGESYTKRTLRATFGVEAVRSYVREKDINFIPSNKIFRSYKIIGGRRVFLANTFIQRTRKEGGLRGGRLSFGGEIRSIKATRRNKVSFQL